MAGGVYSVAGISGGCFESFNACHFAPAFSYDVGLVQLYALVPLLYAPLIGDDHTHSHLASVVRFVSLLALHSDWLSEDI